MNFRSIMMTKRNEESVEQREKKEQSSNIIVHGKEENKGQSDDALLVNNTIQQVCGNVMPQLISRIGWSKGNKKKPIKGVLHNEWDKEKILNNLKKLKGNTKCKGTSTTEDTVSEWQMITEFANKA